jgi:hypothetical protein
VIIREIVGRKVRWNYGIYFSTPIVVCETIPEKLPFSQLFLSRHLKTGELLTGGNIKLSTSLGAIAEI